MSFNSPQMIHRLRADFERLLALETGPKAHTATMGQMERSLFRQVLRLGFKLLQLFVMARVEAESHAPLMRSEFVESDQMPADSALTPWGIHTRMLPMPRLPHA
jgi:hypothetical protein